MKLLTATLFAATALVATNAMANADLAKKSNCLSCHAVDKKLVGPSYQDIAKKYAGQKDAEAMLFEKVKKGGKGTGARSRCRRMPTSRTMTSRRSSSGCWPAPSKLRRSRKETRCGGFFFGYRGKLCTR